MSQILLIDPSALSQELIPLALGNKGFAIECCRPAAALETIETLKPRLLIYEPGGMVGLSLLRQLHGTSSNKDISVIILSDAASRELVLEAAYLGALYIQSQSRTIP